MSAGLIVLRPGDAGRLADLHRTGFDTSWSAASWASLLGRAGVLCLGMEQDGGALQAAICVQYAADVGEILTLVVAPHARRQGLGRQLVQAALVRAGERGAARLLLDVSVTNAAARALYRGMGFSEDGVRRAYYRDGSDAILLSRDLALSTGQEHGTGPF